MAAQEVLVVAEVLPEELHGINLEEIPLRPLVAALQAAVNAVFSNGFVMARTKRKVRRLHFVGCCGKVSGEHYKDFEVWGDFLPPEEEIDVTCLLFKGKDASLLNLVPGPDKDTQELEESSSSSSSTSSSDESDPVIATKARKT